MEPYPDPNPNAGERNYYNSTPNQPQQHIDADGGGLNNMGHAIAPAMHTGIPNSQDLRPHPQTIGFYQQQSLADPNLHIRHNMQDDNDHDPMDQSGHGYSNSDPSMPPRKRSKASRACDECRKKKVKCDSTEERENVQEACSNCRRSGAECMFSRIPQKRGPSKGYIKELSDRVRKLESTPLQNGMMDGSMVGGVEYASANLAELAQRKRTFAETESGHELVGHMYSEAAPTSSRALAPSPYPPSSAQFSPPPHPQFIQQSPPQLSRPESGDPQNLRGPSLNSNTFQSQQYLGRPLWTTGPAPPRTSSTDIALHSAGDGNLSASANPSAQSVINQYYNMHLHLSITPIKVHTMVSRLERCSAPLVDTFYMSMHAASRSLSSSDPSKYEGLAHPAALHLLTTAPLPNDANNRVAKVTQLQILIFMAMEALHQASSPLNSPSARNVPTSVWLSNAVGLAFDIKLHMVMPSKKTAEDYDEDAEENVERRLWWSLCVIERWHAHSTGSPSMIPEQCITYYREDKVTLGTPLYWLARLTVTMGHIIHDNTSTTGPLPKLNTLPRRELDFWRLDVPETFGDANPILHLCFWHIMLLDFLSIPSLTPLEVQEATDHLVSVFLQQNIDASPLVMSIKVLLILALIEFLRHKETEEVAKKDLKALREGGHIPSGWEKAIRRKIDTNISQAKAHEGLQKLAEAAHGKAVANRAADGGENLSGSENAVPSNSKSPPPHHFEELLALTKRGYLYAFRDDFI